MITGDKNQIMTVEEVAGMFRVHRSTIARFAMSGELKSYKLGSRRLFKTDDAWAFFESRAQENPEARNLCQMATVHVLKRKRKDCVKYAVLYKDPVTLKSKYYKTYDRSKDAQAAAHRLRELIDNGKVLEVDKSKQKTQLMTFAEVAELLTEKWEERLSQGDLAQKTYDEYLIGLNVVVRAFDRRLLTEITKEDILAYRKGLAEEHSNIYANRLLFLIKQVFLHAMEINVVPENPAVDIRYLSEKKHERNKFLMPDELNHLIETVRSTPSRAWKHLPALVLLGAEHGASRQECLSLKWEDIDFEFDGKGMIRFFRTKNGHERTEYLMPRTREALMEWRDHLEFMRRRHKIVPVQDDFVFCRLDGKPIVNFSKAWREARKLAGFDWLHFHDLRHTYCSNLLLSGATLKDVCEMIGHHDLSMTNRYAHLTLQHKKGKQEKLAEFYGE